MVHDRLESLSRVFPALDCDGESKTIVADRCSASSQGKDIALADASSPVSTSNTWVGSKRHFERAALPLMLLRPVIRESLHLLTSHNPGTAALPIHDANWIKDELEDLLAICHENAAASLRKLPNNAVKSTTPTERTTTPLRDIAQQGGQLRKEKEILATKFLLKESPTGNVSVRVQCARDIASGTTAVSDIILLLAPKPAIHEDGFLVSLSRLNEGFNHPVIHRSLSGYAVVEPDSLVFECVRSNDIQQLRKLLSSRQVTPDIRNTENESLLSVCA